MILWERLLKFYIQKYSITALLVFMNILCDFIVFKHFIELLHTLYLWLAAFYILILYHDDNMWSLSIFLFLARIFQEGRYPIDEETVSIRRGGLEETHKEKYGWMKFSRGHFESWLRKCKHQVFWCSLKEMPLYNTIPL